MVSKDFAEPGMPHTTRGPDTLSHEGTSSTQFDANYFVNFGAKCVSSIGRDAVHRSSNTKRDASKSQTYDLILVNAGGQAILQTGVDVWEKLHMPLIFTSWTYIGSIFSCLVGNRKPSQGSSVMQVADVSRLGGFVEVFW